MGFGKDDQVTSAEWLAKAELHLKAAHLSFMTTLEAGDNPLDGLEEGKTIEVLTFVRESQIGLANAMREMAHSKQELESMERAEAEIAAMKREHPERWGEEPMWETNPRIEATKRKTGAEGGN